MPDNTYAFRLQYGDGGALSHWETSVKYDNTQIAAIKSSNEHSLHQPTSIPSPFARIALVKTAFAEVKDHGENALAAYQKIVSDTLDVAEIFFTYDRWRDKIKIIKWDKAEHLEQLKNGHRQLYKTLKTFLDNDAEDYNFDRLQGIYILKHEDTQKIIGATSPSTLFFSTENDLSGLDISLTNNRKAFAGIVPLSARSWDFQKYLHVWIAANNENRIIDGKAQTRIFHEFADYLDKQKNASGRIREINDAIEIAGQLINSYQKLRAPDVEVLGKPLYQMRDIKASIEHLTADDLLENYIIRIPNKIEKESFFDGNLNDASNKSYLLPIKDKFFVFFGVDDLKQFITLNSNEKVVEVELKIENFNFTKRYTVETDQNLIDIEGAFDCAIFPNVRFQNENMAQYRFGLVCDYKARDKFKAQFIKRNSKIDNTKLRSSVRNESRTINYQLQNYSLEGSGFDYIRIDYNKKSGIVIPNLKQAIENDVYTFAVDFGTTNTHIEYKINNSRESRAFDILKNPIDQKQVHWLHGKDSPVKRVFDEEYIPAYTDDEFKFPTRTALSFGEQPNWNDVYPFEKASINELYEKKFDFGYNNTITNLKWADGENYQNQVKVYIQSLMYLLRNKVVLGNGKLEETKIRWFYPVSMERGRFNNLNNAWKEAYRKYFGGDEANISSITESVAPFNYYVRDRNARNLVTIDIGGGTTDIVISDTGEVDYITSFRFAADAIFGDGYAENDREKNGIVRQFKEEIRKVLVSHNNISENDELIQVLDSIYENNSSADIASFLFSLNQNKKVRDAGENLAKNANLARKLVVDDSQKITFIFFYSAIIYHLAKLMKAKNLVMPDKMVFSGNGSRVIQFFTDDKQLLEGYTKLIFKKIYNANEYPRLEIIINKDNPKEATCKGAFYRDEPEAYGDILRKIVVLHSNGTDAVVQRVRENHEEISLNDKYEFIDEVYLKGTETEVRNFIQFVFKQLLPFFNLEGFQLNNESVELAKEVCIQKLDIHLQNGWALKNKGIDKAHIIDETLFFYPLIGMLKDLADAICDRRI